MRLLVDTHALLWWLTDLIGRQLRTDVGKLALCPPGAVGFLAQPPCGDGCIGMLLLFGLLFGLCFRLRLWQYRVLELVERRRVQSLSKQRAIVLRRGKLGGQDIWIV